MTKQKCGYYHMLKKRKFVNALRSAELLQTGKLQANCTTMARVFQATGTVRITEGRASRVAEFRGTVTGETENEQRANFRYWRTVYSSDKQRKKMQELEEQGKIELLTLHVGAELGLCSGLQFKNNPYI